MLLVTSPSLTGSTLPLFGIPARLAMVSVVHSHNVGDIRLTRFFCEQSQIKIAP